MVLIEEVAFEHGLGCWVLQVDLVFFDGVSVLPLLVVDVILVEVVIILTWKETGLCSSFLK